MWAWHNPYHRARISADSSPDRTIRRAWHHRVEAGHDALVLGGIGRLVGLHICVSLAVPVGVQDQCRPALRLGCVVGGVPYLRVKPSNHWTAAAGPQRLVGVKAELQVVRAKARINKL